MTEYLKGSKVAWFWTIIRVWFGYEWFSHGWDKFTGKTSFDASAFIKGAIAKSVPATAGAKPVVADWWGSFLKGFALPNIKMFNVLVMYGEMLVGLALIFGFVTIFAATMGALMNFSFLMSGSTSSNPWNFAVSFIFALVGGKIMGYYGVDYFMMPKLKAWVADKFDAVRAKSVA
ncbi:MAG TPA: DoxX family membrane protein [Symbiobacteriaceae bacterium]|nr:DoxX family membrane protein [Symbiobacteriaceae bacterium]